MSYNLTVQCGCVVYVSCDPKTGFAHARVIERKGEKCLVRKHDVGVRLYLWELLPEPANSGLESRGWGLDKLAADKR